MTDFADIEASANEAIVELLANASAIHTPAGGLASAATDCIHMQPKDAINELGIVAPGHCVIVGQSTWPTAREGDTLTLDLLDGADAADYRVRAVLPEQANGLKLVTLAEA
jgi:hypothetical protein